METTKTEDGVVELLDFDLQIANARESIKQLFAELNITKVICVDDYYYVDYSDPEVIISLYREEHSDYLATLPDFSGFPSGAGILIQSEFIRQTWATIKYDLRITIYKYFKSKTEEDRVEAQILSKLLTNQDFKFEEWTPGDWLKGRPQLPGKRAKSKVLLLFDQILNQDPEITTQDGMTLIKDVITGDNLNVICGLLSNVLGGIEDAHDEWYKLSESESLALEQFIYIPKEYLSLDLLGFVRMTKLAALNKPCAILTRKVARTIQNTITSSISEITKINIYDFEHIIFKSSLSEGVWEVDTLFRLFEVYHRKEERKFARQTDAILNLASKIRRISKIAAESSLSPKHTSWKIRRLELYEDIDYVNSLHLPLELGDIFEKVNKTGPGKKFILIGQPCDLMVRTESGQRRTSTTSIVLAEIELKQPNSNDLANSSDFQFELPYFNPLTGASHFVNFTKTENVRLWVLDLCVYRKDGLAKISPNDTCPLEVIPAWEKHFRKVQEPAIKAITQSLKLRKLKQEIKQNKLSIDLEDDILKLAIPFSSDNNVFKATINDNPTTFIEYNCKRVGRLSVEYSTALLAKFTHYQARTAFEHDFARELRES